jgi:hypothetical protein
MASLATYSNQASHRYPRGTTRDIGRYAILIAIQPDEMRLSRTYNQAEWHMLLARQREIVGRRGLNLEHAGIPWQKPVLHNNSAVPTKMAASARQNAKPKQAPIAKTAPGAPESRGGGSGGKGNHRNRDIFWTPPPSDPTRGLWGGRKLKDELDY